MACRKNERHSDDLYIKTLFVLSCALYKRAYMIIRHFCLNPFQSNFSTTRILPSSYLFWAGKRVDYL
jgi:hypothetical protein